MFCSFEDLLETKRKHTRSRKQETRVKTKKRRNKTKYHIVVPQPRRGEWKNRDPYVDVEDTEKTRRTRCSGGQQRHGG